MTERIFKRALLRVLELSGNISTEDVRTAIGTDVLTLLTESKSDEVMRIDKLEQEELIRSRLRDATTNEELMACIESAEAAGMWYETGLGQRKLSKLNL